MNSKQSSIVFNNEWAPIYDKLNDKLSPMHNALHFLTRAILSELPSQARILCVGVGTGKELVNLAQAFPQWIFTAVEPAAPMLNVCRRRVEENGLSARCTFHEGYLNSLPPSELFDAATSFLVSQFIIEKNERRQYFHQIAERLCYGGYLIASDFAADMSVVNEKAIFEVLLRMLQISDWPNEEIDKLRNSYGRNISVLPQKEVEEIIISGGFDTPVLFLRTLLIHGWFAKRKDHLELETK